NCLPALLRVPKIFLTVSPDTARKIFLPRRASRAVLALFCYADSAHGIFARIQEELCNRISCGGIRTSREGGGGGGRDGCWRRGPCRACRGRHRAHRGASEGHSCGDRTDSCEGEGTGVEADFRRDGAARGRGRRRGQPFCTGS